MLRNVTSDVQLLNDGAKRIRLLYLKLMTKSTHLKNLTFVINFAPFLVESFFSYASHAKVCHKFCTNSIFGRFFFFDATQP
jgi:hypothetical protein